MDQLTEYQLTFSLDEFLSLYWQKKPTIIKQGFKNFRDPISAEELAGLTMEEEIDSRFVSNLNDDWCAEHGPFDETKFSTLNDSHWQFIVQAANHWHQGAAQLVKPFKQLPQWLFDDLMISYSVQGGGVGPHIDQYDVFIIQGSGRRHWRVGAKDIGQYKETCRSSALRQIEGFDAVIDAILEPGDILYIPPGYPHDGYALEPSMSYSVGYRSPKEQELVSNFADYILAHDMGDVHLSNPDLRARQQFGEIQQQDLTQLTEMLTSALEHPETIKDFMGCMLSQSRHQLDIVEPQEKWEAEEIQYYLQQGGPLHKVSGLRALYHQGESNIAYINGEVIKVPTTQCHILETLCNQDEFQLKDLDGETDASTISLLCNLVNKGYWYLLD
ncbi:cupin domain-containing protein [Vibrio sp. SCSIO 43135]|uniref:ribosomal protein uL16 3-hydroxylase n=1 Tax=Vibrio sp. SCSIO 43135 TaxID=2819096 RepID=UPI002074B694|nr:cupin domain-containing protein [Vibrio sp. SCSIO 43135]USD40215.1 cupin domain-containing protein [Vibrio sp. SCSIO 43135]